MRILIIEDDEDKLNAILGTLRKDFPGCVIDIARSFGSGLRAVISNSSQINVVLLDMSMPNFDVTPEEPSGGNPEPFAGRELLAQMRLREINVPAIVVTMFDSFGDKDVRISLNELVEELKANFSPPYKATIYYDSRQEGWRTALRDEIITVMGATP